MQKNQSKPDPALPYIDQVMEIAPMSYREWLNERVRLGIEGRETLGMYHVVLRKEEFDERGKNNNPYFVQTYTAREMNPHLMDIKSVMERQNYSFNVIYDPTGTATAVREEPDDVITAENAVDASEGVAVVQHPVRKKGGVQ